MFFYHNWGPVMTRRRQYTAKRRLLQKLLALQRRKRAEAEARNDAGEVERIEKRMLTVEALN